MFTNLVLTLTLWVATTKVLDSSAGRCSHTNYIFLFIFSGIKIFEQLLYIKSNGSLLCFVMTFPTEWSSYWRKFFVSPIKCPIVKLSMNGLATKQDANSHVYGLMPLTYHHCASKLWRCSAVALKRERASCTAAATPVCTASFEQMPRFKMGGVDTVATHSCEPSLRLCVAFLPFSTILT